MASCTPAAPLFTAVKPRIRQLHGNSSVSTPQEALQHMQEQVYHTQHSFQATELRAHRAQPSPPGAARWGPCSAPRA